MTMESPSPLANSAALPRAAFAVSEPSKPTTIWLTVPPSSIRHHGRFALDGALEDPGVRRLPLALEERRVDEVRDHQEDHTHEEQPDPDRDRRPDSQEATGVVDVGARRLVVEEGLDEDEGQYRAPEE